VEYFDDDAIVAAGFAPPRRERHRTLREVLTDGITPPWIEAGSWVGTAKLLGMEDPRVLQRLVNNHGVQLPKLAAGTGRHRAARRAEPGDGGES
jgi:hypothetical protein